jgi:galactan 5-O-arabinofuranosyltransferase
MGSPVSGCPPQPGPPPVRGHLLVRFGALLLAVLVGWAVLWALGRLTDVRAFAPGERWTVFAVVELVVAALTVGIWVTVRRGSTAATVVVAATSVVLCGLATVALHGTRWSFNGLYSDAGFRTEAATRFADTAASADYGYRGLPAYYPPALPWLEGRLALLLDVPAWAAMKPVTLVMAALVPVLGWLLWRRVLADLPAALVTAAVVLATVDLVRPDEFLVLTLVVPWWLDLVRGLRRPGVRPLPAWAYGAVLGVLLLFHTFYFVPLAVATVAGVVVDVVRRRPWPLRPARAAVVAAVGVLIASPYWVPMAMLKLSGAPSDNLQMRWSEPGFELPPWPDGVGLVGLLGLAGVVWLVLRVRRCRLAETLALTLAATYAFYLGGQWLQRWQVAVLPEKSGTLIAALLATSGVLALYELLGALLRSSGQRRVGLLRAVAVAVSAALVLTAVGSFAATWVIGTKARAAQRMRYPDGSWPSGGPPTYPTTRHPWSVLADGRGEPSVDQVRATWRQLTGRSMSDRTLLVTTRADLLATTPVHSFIAWKSIYSHPYGRFTARLDLLRHASRCADARCAWRLLRDNPYDRVDGLVLTRTAAGLHMDVATDIFPNGWVTTPIDFRPGLFSRPYFTRRDAGDVAVVALSRR